MAVWYRLLLLLIVVFVSSEKCKFQFILDVVTIKNWEPDLIEEVNATLVQINNRSYANGYLILRKNIDKLNVNTTMDFWKKDNERRRVYSLQMDACRFLTIIHKNSLLSILSKSFKEHMNGTLKCPLKAHQNYSLQNWYLDEQNFPCYTIPEGTFQTITEYIIRTKRVLRIVVRGRVLY